MALSLTPELVLQGARQLGINLDEPTQLHLLSVAKAFVTLPLPEFYKRVVDEQGELQYLDRR